MFNVSGGSSAARAAGSWRARLFLKGAICRREGGADGAGAQAYGIWNHAPRGAGSVSRVHARPDHVRPASGAGVAVPRGSAYVRRRCPRCSPHAARLALSLIHIYEAKVAAAVEEARALPGIGYVRVWLNSGELAVGDDIMLVLIGGDIRPRVIDGLQRLVATIKNTCVVERELSE